MTLPTTNPPYPVVYPDEAILLNFYGTQPLHRSIANYVEPYESKEGSGRVHNTWRDDKIKSLIDARFNNELKHEYHMGYKPSTLTYTAKDSRKPLYGGVVETPEGKLMIKERLEQRKTQYDSLGTASFSTALPIGSSILPPLTPQMTAPYDDAMTTLADAIQSGYIDRTLLEALTKANSALISVGPLLSDTKINDYMNYLNSMTQSVEALISDLPESGTNVSGLNPRVTKRILDSLLLGLTRQYKVLNALNKIVYEPINVKQQLLHMEQGKKLPTEIENIYKKGPAGLDLVSKAEKRLPTTATATESVASRQEPILRARTWLDAIRTGKLPKAFERPSTFPEESLM